MHEKIDAAVPPLTDTQCDPPKIFPNRQVLSSSHILLIKQTAYDNTDIGGATRTENY